MEETEGYDKDESQIVEVTTDKHKHKDLRYFSTGLVGGGKPHTF